MQDCAPPLSHARQSVASTILTIFAGGGRWMSGAQGVEGVIPGDPVFSARSCEASVAPASGCGKLWLMPAHMAPRGALDPVVQYSTLLQSVDGGATWRRGGGHAQLRQITAGACRKGVQTPLDVREGRCTPVRVLLNPRRLVLLADDQVRASGSPHEGALVYPSLAVMNNDALVMFFGSTVPGNNSLFRSDSADQGLSWTMPKATGMPNNGAPIAAHGLQRAGHLVLVFNNAGLLAQRWPLSIALSHDGGQTWPWVRDLEPAAPSVQPNVSKIRGLYGRRRVLQRGEDEGFRVGAGSRWGEGTIAAPPISRSAPAVSPPPPHWWNKGEFSHPVVMQTPDETIHIAYTFLRESIQYLRVTENWIMRGGGTLGLFKGQG
ncbi:hypothetical protein CYMTET_56834 [Cymbomonas tetramitiformis]|uniref:Sialidase domain-containing protein n=1 Tax=Cymbomonas tetramitiformis TaxID=36881 RepID=A0AAE0ELF8_9CHLO|nr:hypothetical protein CYMTET_56834 [Cymbomonas tetramitiformis]